MGAFRYLFPIPQAVLQLGSHTELHEAALGVLSPHMTPWDPLVPREAGITVLLHALGTVPAFRRAHLLWCLRHMQLRARLSGRHFQLQHLSSAP